MRDQWDAGFPVPPPSRDTDVRDQRVRDTWHHTKSSRNVPPPWEVGSQLGEFVLQELLGQGSSGYVYRVLDQVSGRKCALKLIRAEEPTELVRIKLGFRRMMTVDHPHLLRVDRIHQLEDRLGLSMEEIEGETLRDFVRGLSAVEPATAYDKLLQLTRDYASALAHMHAKGFVHRDIKPANLMVDKDGRGIVIDYGLVGTFNPDTDPYGARDYLVGTPMYVAPEVLRNQHHGAASDIFSLGVVLLESIHTVTGSACVTRSDQSRAEDLKGVEQSLSGMDDQVPELLRDACIEMLEFMPSLRPSAAAVARLGLPPSASALPSMEPSIYGRSNEFEQIHRWIDSIYRGETGRLHLTGPSGIGKSRVVEKIIAYVESKRWGQVFHARCHLREDQPMQAFGQITDAIVARYTRGDREQLEVDPVSHSVLMLAFPALSEVVEANMDLSPMPTHAPRLDGLDAATRLSVELRKVGPLILVVDDVQWADRDSLNVLDRLQSVSDGMLGVVTVARDGVDHQRLPPTETIELRPLKLGDCVQMLLDAATRWSVAVDPELLQQLAEVTEGCPYRLVELAEEFRPGGLLSAGTLGSVFSGLLPDGTQDTSANSDDSTAPITQIDQLWNRRMDRLSGPAKQALRLVVTAGRSVAIEQLEELLPEDVSVDAAVSELVQQRLVIDDATGGECICVRHDRITDRLIDTLDKAEQRDAHKQWATLLMRKDRPEELAARIARHLIEAGEPGRAVSYSILAAEDADRRFAKTEAAYWHQRVIPFVTGTEKIQRIRQAAHCFDMAHRPMDAASHYQQLALLVDEPERFECELRSITRAVRCGRFDQVRKRLQRLCERIGAPRPKPAWRSKLSILASGMRLRSQSAALERIASVADPADLMPAAQPPDNVQRRMRLCTSLARAMSMFDNLLALEMNITATLDALKYGQPSEKLYAAIGSAVFGCYDNDRRRTVSEMMLLKLHQPVLRTGDAKLMADLWAAIACSHACSGRWYRALGPARRSVDGYRNTSDPHSFEISHTRWTELWSCFHLGRISSLVQICDEMHDTSIHCRDRFAEMMATLGIGGAAWLARDDAGGLDVRRHELVGNRGTAPTELIDVFAWIGQMQSLIYEGDWQAASSLHHSFRKTLGQLPYRKIQLVRMHGEIFGALIALQADGGSGVESWADVARNQVRKLRREENDFAAVVADLFEGLILRRTGQDEAAILFLQRARRAAIEQYLRPWQFAAEDALDEIQIGQPGDRLQRRLADEGVRRPEKFERLYTVRFKN